MPAHDDHRRARTTSSRPASSTSSASRRTPSSRDPHLEAEGPPGRDDRGHRRGTSPGPVEARSDASADYFAMRLREKRQRRSTSRCSSARQSARDGHRRRQSPADRGRDARDGERSSIRPCATARSASRPRSSTCRRCTPRPRRSSISRASRRSTAASTSRHIRDEGDHIDSALDEAFRIGREANIPVNIWHLKVGGPRELGTHAARDRAHQRRARRGDRRRGERLSVRRVVDVALHARSRLGAGRRLQRDAEAARRSGAARAHRRGAARAVRTKRGRARDLRRRASTTRRSRSTKRNSSRRSPTVMNLPPDEALMKLFAETDDLAARDLLLDERGRRADRAAAAVRLDRIRLRRAVAASRAPKQSPCIRARTARSRAWSGHYVRDEQLFTLEEAVRKTTSQAADRIAPRRPRHPASRHEGGHHRLRSRRKSATSRRSKTRTISAKAFST